MKKATLFLLACSLSCGANASGEYEIVGRYHEVKVEIKQYQMEPLLQRVTVEFPDGISTLAEAFTFLLTPSGYSLASAEYLDPRFIGILNKPLPVNQRKLRGTVIDLLHTLAGKRFLVVIDSLNRTVSLDSANDN